MKSMFAARTAALALGLAALTAWAADPPKGPAGWETTHKFAMGGVADKGATTVLFIHGLSSSARTWQNPMSAANMTRVDYDPKVAISVGGAVDVVYSPKAPRNANFFSTFGQHFKVATWSQTPCHDVDQPESGCTAVDLFDNAYKSAPWALRKVLDETTGPIAIVGHSRGGLIGRRLLKEFGDANGRIKWFVTLHTPHKGSGLSTRSAAMNDVTAGIIKLMPKEAQDVVNSARDGVIAMVGNQGGEELGATGSMSIFPKLTAGEKQPPAGVKLMSFGGNSTTVLKLFVRAPLIGTDCPANKDFDAGLCYPKCASGYKGVGPVCWQNCPSGFSDHGVGCTKPAPYGRGAGYPWKFGDGLNDNGMYSRCRGANPQGCEKSGAIVYPKCKSGYHAVGCCICTPDCQGGMTDTGATCLKKTNNRGAASSPSKTFDLFTSPTVSELMNGRGDLLVTDASSRMPWPAPHVTQALHHGEVLWHTGTMQQVITFLKVSK